MATATTATTAPTTTTRRFTASRRVLEGIEHHARIAALSLHLGGFEPTHGLALSLVIDATRRARSSVPSTTPGIYRVSGHPYRARLEASQEATVVATVLSAWIDATTTTEA